MMQATILVNCRMLLLTPLYYPCLWRNVYESMRLTGRKVWTWRQRVPPKYQFPRSRKHYCIIPACEGTSLTVWNLPGGRYEHGDSAFPRNTGIHVTENATVLSVLVKAHLWLYETYRVESMNMATARNSKILISIHQTKLSHPRRTWVITTATSNVQYNLNF
jgi:hypothetical protein